MNIHIYMCVYMIFMKMQGCSHPVGTSMPVYHNKDADKQKSQNSTIHNNTSEVI